MAGPLLWPSASSRGHQVRATDLPGYAGRVHDYFAAHPDRYRLMAWGQLELDDTDRPADDPIRATIAHKVDQLRRAQEAGHLDPDWDPIDILVLLNQLAAAWADKPDPAAAVPAPERAGYLAARRAAIVAAVQRLFPSASTGSHPNSV